MCMKYCANNSAELCKHVDVTGLKRPIATGQGSKKFLVCVQFYTIKLAENCLQELPTKSAKMYFTPLSLRASKCEDWLECW